MKGDNFAPAINLIQYSLDIKVSEWLIISLYNFLMKDRNREMIFPRVFLLSKFLCQIQNYRILCLIFGWNQDVLDFYY